MTEALIIAIIGAGATIVNTLIIISVKRNVKAVKMEINGQMAKFLELTGKSSKAEGREEQRLEQVEIDKNK